MKKFKYSLPLFLVGSSIFLPACQVKNKPEKHPNIIVLLADDLRYDALGVAGNPIIKTPNLDKLAEDGCYFTNAFVTTSICSVSRASILTGQYSRRHGIYGFARGLDEQQMAQTYPMELKRHGYATGFIGKYGIGNKMPSGKYDYWKGFPGQGVYQAKDKNGNPIHLTKLITEEMDEFINQYGNKSAPFCLSVSFKAPHVQEDQNPNTPLFPFEKRYSTQYSDSVMPLPETAGNQYYMKFSERFRKDVDGVMNEGRKRWEDRFSTFDKYQKSVKGYYRLISGLDDAVGHLRNSLREKGLSKNTIIIFLSDNGFYLSEHGLAGKWYGHEESIRIPMIVLDPRHESVKRDSNIVLNIDVAPTVLDFANVEIPTSMQGKSLVKLAQGKQTNWRKDFLYEHLMNLKKGKGWYVYIPQTEGVVSQDYRYMRYFTNNDDQHPIYQEFYDTHKDPKEKVNLVNVDTTKVEIYRKRLSELIQNSK